MTRGDTIREYEFLRDSGSFKVFREELRSGNIFPGSGIQAATRITAFVQNQVKMVQLSVLEKKTRESVLHKPN